MNVLAGHAKPHPLVEFASSRDQLHIHSFLPIRSYSYSQNQGGTHMAGGIRWSQNRTKHLNTTMIESTLATEKKKVARI